ncbi:hypothetical protein BHM03_00037570 [Ensete ventricosum]|nr:hypothetical protein BHM03_00037570 [Ensete ventricosum]
MTIRQKSPRLRAPSTHVYVKSYETNRASQALSITLFTIYGKGSHYPTNTIVQKDIMSNKVTYNGSTCGIMKHTYANMNQYDINIIFHIMHSDRQRIKDKCIQEFKTII